MSEFDDKLEEFKNKCAILSKYRNIDIVYSKEFIEFNNNLSFVIKLFYELTIDLYSKFNIDYSKSRYYSFFIDFILSLPSNKIFTETPRIPIKQPLTINSIKIVNLFKALDKLSKTSNYQSKDVNITFISFFHHSFAFFDFIYSEKNEKGKFPNFIIKNEIFTNFYLKFYKFYEDIDSKEINQLKHLCYLSPRIYISRILNYYKIDDKDYNELEQYYNNKIYDKYVEKSKEKHLPLEILSYIFTHLVWKSERIFHTTPEYYMDNDYNKEFLINTKKFIEDNLRNIKKFYNNGTLEEYYYNMNVVYQDYIDKYLLKELLPNVEIDDVKYKKITTNDKNSNYFKNIDKSIDLKEKYSSFINKMINNEHHKRFKFYRYILSTNNYDELTLPLDILYNELINSIKKKKIYNFRFIGMLHSGSFLAHIVNIMCIEDEEIEYNNLESFSILTHPFISILPRKIIKRENGKPITFIYLDESIKTGYSVTIADLFRKRLLSLNNTSKSKDDFVFSLTKFKEYNDILDIEKEYIADISIEDKKLKIDKNNIFIENNLSKIFNWKEYINALPSINEPNNELDIRKEIINLSKIKINRQDRLDFTILLSHSQFLFTICKYFAEKLLDIINDNKEEDNLTVKLFFGTNEAKLLIDITIFILKIKGIEKNVNFLINKDETEEKNILNIFFDLTIMSGYTKEIVEKIDNNEKKFDYSFVILSKSKNDKIISIIDTDYLKEGGNS